MKVFVTGVGGQLGYDVVNELTGRGVTCVGSDVAPSYSGTPGGAAAQAPYEPLDITDEAAVMETIQRIRPDAVIHCAAWTAVDLAEDEDKKETVRRVNAEGTEHVARACAAVDAKMIYISTDYVFDGQGTKAWQPDCEAYAPLNYYGQTKLDGERAVAENLNRYFIVRIAWVFGKNGNNFIRTMLKVGKDHEKLRVVNDQIGTPTYTYDLAALLADMIQSEKYGYYHASNEGGYISWYDFAVEIFRQAAALGHEEYDGDHLEVQPVTTEEYGASKAQRPKNSRLDKSKLREQGFTPLPDWRDALQRYLREIM